MESPGTVACTTALPTRWPVKVALFASPAMTKSVFVTLPVRLISTHEAAPLVTKFPNWSRQIANKLVALPAITFWARVTMPAPLANVSARTCDAAAGRMISVWVAEVRPGVALVIVGVPTKVSRYR